MNKIVRSIVICTIGILLLACNLGNALAPAKDAATAEPLEAPSEISETVQQTPSLPTIQAPAQPDTQSVPSADPCSWITTAEVEVILAEPASAPKAMSGACTFSNAKDNLYMVSIGAAQDKETSGFLQAQAILLGFAGVRLDEPLIAKIKPLSEALDFKGYFTELVLASKGAPAVQAKLFTGGGNDLVYWAWLTAQSRRQGAFVAVRGTTLVNINLVVADTQTEESMLAASTTLANEIFTRLPVKFSVVIPTVMPAQQPAENPIPTLASAVEIPTATLAPP